MVERRSTRKRMLIWVIILSMITFVILLLSAQFEINGRITSGGRVRKYLIYVPDSYDPDAPTPLVISIHGFVQWPAHQQSLSGWNQLADEAGFLVVYPRGTGFPLRWNTTLPSDDLGFFSDLLDHLERTYNIDPSRIYVNGMSNGGGMSDLLACELSDRIAAIGGVAGAYLYPREDCQPTRPVPVIAFHGVDDQVVPYQGGSSSRGFYFDPVEDWIRSWAEKNSCSKTPTKVEITENITQLEYSDCDDDTRVVFYSIRGAGHTWPGGEELPVWITGYTNQEINASALMWEFFRDFTVE